MKIWNFKRRLRKHVRLRKCFVNYADVKRIMLLFESGGREADETIRMVAERLRADGKEVVARGYAADRKGGAYSEGGMMVFTRKQTGRLGVPNKEVLQKIAGEYDLLIDVTFRSLLPLQYLLLYTDAACTTGVQDGRLLRADLMIQMPVAKRNEMLPTSKEIEFFLEQLMFYLKTIRSAR